MNAQIEKIEEIKKSAGLLDSTPSFSGKGLQVIAKHGAVVIQIKNRIIAVAYSCLHFEATREVSTNHVDEF